MVEINKFNRKARSSICWRGRRELITDVRKPETAVVDVICGGELFTDYSDHPRKLVTLNRKTQINRRRTLPASFPLWDAYRKQRYWPERLSPKSQDAVALQQIKERGALPMIDRGGYPSGNRPLQQYLGFTAGRWLWSVRA